MSVENTPQEVESSQPLREVSSGWGFLGGVASCWVRCGCQPGQSKLVDALNERNLGQKKAVGLSIAGKVQMVTMKPIIE